MNQENYRKLLSKIDIEYNQLVDKNSKYKEVATATISELAHLPFNDAVIEFSNDTIHFKLSFPDKKLLMIDKFLDPKAKGLSDSHVFYSFFIKRELISSNVVEIKDLKHKKYGLQ